MVLFIWNNALVANVAGALAIVGLETGRESISGALNISDYTQSFDHNKSSSISQSIKGNSRDLQTLLTFFNGTKNYLSHMHLILPNTIYYLYLIWIGVLPQISRSHRKIVTEL